MGSERAKVFPSLYFVFYVTCKCGVIVSYVTCRNGAFTYVNYGVSEVFCGCIYGCVIVHSKTL